MEIIITKDKTLKTIQQEFAKRFPYLKIVFYSNEHLEGTGSHQDNILHNEQTIEQVQKKESTGNLQIHGLLKVSELESAFSEFFGLPVQVFRQSGEIWLQTTTTDSLTLAEQNHIAMEKNRSANGSTDQIDYREQE
jgi:hypothetical protein